MSIKKEIQYSVKNKIIDSRFSKSISNTASVVMQTFKKGSFPTNLISSIQMVNFSLSKSKVISSSYLFSSNIISNFNQLDNLVFCRADNSIYWTNKTNEVPAKLTIKSIKKDEYLINLPERSYVKRHFISSNGKKIKIMVNFNKRLGKYITQGFGSYELEATCQ